MLPALIIICAVGVILCLIKIIFGDKVNLGVPKPQRPKPTQRDHRLAGWRTGHTILAVVAIIFWFIWEAYLPTWNFLCGQWGPVLFGFLCAFIATIKKRNAVAWFAWGLYFVFASVIVLLCLPKLHYRLCPFCKRGVAVDAITCPYCTREIDEGKEVIGDGRKDKVRPFDPRLN